MPQPRSAETELKFLVSLEAASALRSHPTLRAPERTESLRSIYYDTPGWELRRRGLALRLRESGEGLVQTLKSQAGGGAVSRGEWEARPARDELDLAALEGTPAAGALKRVGRDLGPVFVTSVERSLRRCARGGAVIEVGYDVGELQAGERHAPIREVELELKEGEPGALFDLARSLAADLDIRLSFESKAERGYRLADGAELEPRKARRPRLDRAMPAAGAFRVLASSCLAQAAANAEILTERARPEALHQLRVGLRRLRAVMKAFEPMLPGQDGEAVKAELKWLAGELDAARDLDVFIADGYRSALGHVPDDGLSGLGRRLLQAQTQAYDRAGDAVRSRRCTRLWLEAAAWIETGAWTADQEPVARRLRGLRIDLYAAQALDHLCKVVRKRGRRWPRLDARGRHKLRIRAKRLRYAAELFAPLFGAHPKRRRWFMTALRDLQTALGDLNDMAVARDRIPAEAGVEDAGLGFALGRLVGWRESGELAVRQAAAGEVDRFCKARPFWPKSRR